MYQSEYCEVKYEEQYNVVFVKWKKFCCNRDYREPLEYALEIIRAHENCDYVADTRSGFENIPEDTQWVAEYFMPKAAEYGCKCIWFIIDKEPRRPCWRGRVASPPRSRLRRSRFRQRFRSMHDL